MSLILLLLGAALAAPAAQPDVTGAQDPPMLRRYEGSWILGYRSSAFDRLTIPLAAPVRSGSAFSLPKEQVAEGRHTRVLYVAPDGRSPLEVFRNYADALSAAGFQTLYACDDDACGPQGALPKRFLYTREQELDNHGQVSSMAFSQPTEPHFLAAKLSRPEGDVVVSIYAARENFASWKDLTWNRALVLVDVVESAPMEAGKVTVDAEAMGRDLGSGGRAALYGLSFDTNSAALQPSSDATLAEIARLLNNKPDLKLYVVGHTDNVGDLAFNLDLSKKRAEAVVAALTSRYKVDPSRLQAQGVGPLSPVAPNDSEPGRALNRRVELVPR